MARLDEFAPEHQFNEVHRVRIRAPRSRVYRAIKEVTAGEIAFFRALTWIRRLGRRWAQLHQLVYVSAIFAAVHFAWKVKVFSGDPVWYAAVVVVLLGFRLVVFIIRTV